MNHRLFMAVAAALCASSAAMADVYKCTLPDGKVSFSSVPCPTYIGETQPQRKGPPRLGSDWEKADYPHRVNLNATDILKVNRRSKLIITNEREIADNLQKIRPPPPAGPSVCEAPVYESTCFDPSGGRVRKPANP
jgi:hypothetical protein